MDKIELKQRTKQFGLRMIRAIQALSKDPVSDVLGRQLLRSGTSVGANYRAACRAKSRADFINKMGTVEEECDESLYWMEMLIDAKLVTGTKLSALISEGEEILKIIVTSINTAKRNKT
jgi:four helix bundle protein